MLISVYRRIFCLSHPLEHSHKKYKAGKCALKTRKGEASPLDYYVTDGSDNSSHTNSTVGTVLRHPYSDLHCIC